MRRLFWAIFVLLRADQQVDINHNGKSYLLHFSDLNQQKIKLAQIKKRESQSILQQPSDSFKTSISILNGYKTTLLENCDNSLIP